MDGLDGVLNCDIDVLRTLIGGWSTDFAAAGALFRPAALAMIEAYLASGHDMVLPQMLVNPDELALFQARAENAGASYVERFLMDDSESVARFSRRGATYPDDPTSSHDRFTPIASEATIAAATVDIGPVTGRVLRDAEPPGPEAGRGPQDHVPMQVRPAGSAGGGVESGLWHWEVLGGSFAGGAVDRFAEEVGVAGVAGVLLDHVGQQPTQAHPVVGRLIELTVGQRLGE